MTSYKMRTFVTGTSRAGQEYRNASLTVPAAIADCRAADTRFACRLDGATLRYEPLTPLSFVGNERIYKIRSSATGTSITVPVRFAAGLATDACFTCRLDGTCLCYEPVVPTLAAELRALTPGTLLNEMMFGEAVLDRYCRWLRISAVSDAHADLRRLVCRARVADHAPVWCDPPRDGAALLVIDDWLALVIARRDSARGRYAGPHPKRFAAIALRARDVRELPSLDGLAGWALARAIRPIGSVRDRADRALATMQPGWERVVAAIASTGVVTPDRPAWVAADRSGVRWITATVDGRELAVCVRASHFADGPRFVAVSLELHSDAVATAA
jgi:hypothetical protein